MLQEVNLKFLKVGYSLFCPCAGFVYVFVLVHINYIRWSIWRVQSNIPHNLWPRSAMFHNTSLHFLYISTLEIFVHNNTILYCNCLTVNIVNKVIKRLLALNHVWLAISTAGAANRNPEGVSSNNLCLPLEFVSHHGNS
jgi:hypothetical protein